MYTKAALLKAQAELAARLETIEQRSTLLRDVHAQSTALQARSRALVAYNAELLARHAELQARDLDRALPIHLRPQSGD